MTYLLCLAHLNHKKFHLVAKVFEKIHKHRLHTEPIVAIAENSEAVQRNLFFVVAD